eukprot:2683604-Pyramimonas_sp.AAC.1
MQHSATIIEATLASHVSNTELHQPPPDHRPAPTLADGDIRTGHMIRTSPGAASAAASAQTLHVSPVRPFSPTQPIPSQTLSRVSAIAAAPIKEPATATRYTTTIVATY